MENSMEIPLKTRNKTTIWTQQYHFSVYALKKPKLKKTHVPQCSLQHYLQ